jgi:uncharacterized protein (AIM24 family)
MQDPTSYAVAWHDGKTTYVGYVRLEHDALRLEGRDVAGGEGMRMVGYDAIGRIDVSRTNGSRGIVLEVRGADRVVITSLDRPGSLGEMAEQLRGRTDSPHR